MRGDDERSGSLFSYVDLEARVGKDHRARRRNRLRRLGGRPRSRIRPRLDRFPPQSKTRPFFNSLLSILDEL